MARPIEITYLATSATSLGATQAPTSGVALTLITQSNDVQRVLTLTSASNLSGINFVFTGTDASGNVVTETLAGPNANTVTTTNQYLINTNKLTIVPNGTSASTLTVGVGAAGSTRWVGSNLHISPFNVTVAIVVLSGTVSVTVQDTPDEVNANAVEGTSAPNTFNHPTLATLTASAESNYAFPARYIRAVNASGTGSFKMYIIQAGLGGA